MKVERPRAPRSLEGCAGSGMRGRYCTPAGPGPVSVLLRTQIMREQRYDVTDLQRWVRKDI